MSEIEITEAAELITRVPITMVTVEDGWLYLQLADGRRLEVSAEYGQSLVFTVLGQVHT